MDIRTLNISDRFSGLMAVSDIHAEWKSTRDLTRYAKEHNLFVVFLGDIIDGGSDPALVIDEVLFEWLYMDRAAFVIGNHEDKFHRGALGNPVQYKHAQEKTMEQAAEEYKDVHVFSERLLRIASHPATDYIHTYGRWVFAHGAVDESFWERMPNDQSKYTSKQKSKSLYGEVNGSRMPLSTNDKLFNIYNRAISFFKRKTYHPREGFPLRTYGWCDCVPKNKNVVVGHDRRPLNKPKFDAKPMFYRNSNGGNVYFTDTGSGKNRKTGGVTGSVFRFQGNDLTFDHFEFFSNR